MNLVQNIETAAKLFPDKTAILFEGKQIKYSQLNASADRLANAMKVNGVKKGDRVGLYLPNNPEFAVCYYATLKIGAIAVSVNPLRILCSVHHAPGNLVPMDGSVRTAGIRGIRPDRMLAVRLLQP